MIIATSISTLKTQAIPADQYAKVLGYYNAGDGGGGDFFWDNTDTTTSENGGTIFEVTGASGRWKRIYSGAINVKWFGAKGDGIIDDSIAIKLAVQYISKRALTEPDGGWKSSMPTLYFPSGKYAIAEKGALNIIGTALRGYNITGDGYRNTIIIYTYMPESNETDTHLITNGSGNYFGFALFKNLVFYGNGSNSFFQLLSQNGAPQNIEFDQVVFENFVEVVTVRYNTANANADLFKFNNCKARSISGWVFGIDSNLNSQSIIHSFDNCDFEGIIGKCIFIKSGGQIMVRGGSWMTRASGRIIECNDFAATGIGTQSRLLTFYDTKFEHHASPTDPSLDYYPLFFNSSIAIIAFNNCNFNQYTLSDAPAGFFFGRIDRKGKVIFSGCEIPANLLTKITVNTGANYFSNQPELLFLYSTLNAQVANLISLDLTNGTSNTGTYPTIVADGCLNGADNNPIDVSMYSRHAFRNRTAKKKTFVFKVSLDVLRGLPVNTTASFNMPIGATIMTIRIVMYRYVANNNQYTFNVKSADNSILFLTTAPQAPSTVPANDMLFSSGEIHFYIGNEASRMINISSVSDDGATTPYLPGCVEVEYY